MAAVAAAPATPADLLELPVFGGRATRRHVDTWFSALAAARALPDDALPLPLPAGNAPPPANRWAERDPVAAKRLARVRAVVQELSDQLTVPPENLVQPDAVRRLAWQPPHPPEGVDRVTADQVRAALRTAGARPWQVALVADRLAAALAEPATDKPATDEPATDNTATDEPATDNTATDEPATDEPATNDPAAPEP